MDCMDILALLALLVSALNTIVSVRTLQVTVKMLNSGDGGCEIQPDRAVLRSRDSPKTEQEKLSPFPQREQVDPNQE